MTLPVPSTIEAGTSILFLGAGFSAEATNTNDEGIKDVAALITYLLGKVGITSSDGYDLDTAAEEFQKVHGNEATIIALHSNFRTKIYTDDQAMPIRLTHTPTTCWMYPVARIKRGIGRRLGPACDSQQ